MRSTLKSLISLCRAQKTPSREGHSDGRNYVIVELNHKGIVHDFAFLPRVREERYVLVWLLAESFPVLFCRCYTHVSWVDKNFLSLCSLPTFFFTLFLIGLPSLPRVFKSVFVPSLFVGSSAFSSRFLSPVMLLVFLPSPSIFTGVQRFVLLDSMFRCQPVIAHLLFLNLPAATSYIWISPWWE